MLKKLSLRDIRTSLGRFLAIAAIIALGVGLFAGLRVSKTAMVTTGNLYLSDFQFYDFRLVSTLGFTDEDVEAFSDLDGIAAAEGSYFQDVLYVTEDGSDSVIAMHSITTSVNNLDLIAGRMPERANECVVDAELFTEEDIGTTLTLSPNNEEDTLDLFQYDSYTIVGLVNSPLYINFERGSTSLGSGTVSCFGYLLPEGFDSDCYLELYLRFEEQADIYSEEYDALVDQYTDPVEELLEDRADIRYETLLTDGRKELDDGWAELEDAQQEYDEAVVDTEQELSDGWQELVDARQELDDGWVELQDARDTLATESADGQKELDDALKELQDGETELADGKMELEDALKELEDAEADYADGKQELEDGEAEYADGVQEYQNGLAEYEDGKIRYEQGVADYEEGLAKYEDGLAQYRSGKAQYDAGLAQYNDGVAQYEAGKQEFDAKLAALGMTVEDVETTRQQLAAMEPQVTAARQLIAVLLTQVQAMGYPDIATEADLMAALENDVPGVRDLVDGILASMVEPPENPDPPEDPDPEVPENPDPEGPENPDPEIPESPDPDTSETPDSGTTEPTGPDAAEPENGQQAASVRYSAGDPSTSATIPANYVELLAVYEQLKLYDQGKQLVDGYDQLESTRVLLEQTKAQLSSASAQLSSAWSQLQDAKKELNDAKKLLEESETELTDGWAELEDGRAELDDARQELDDGWAELADGRKELDDGWQEYRDGVQDWNDGRQELDDGWQEYYDGVQTLKDEIAKAEQEIADGQQELEDGEQEYADGLVEYDDGKAEAEQKLQDAAEEIADGRQELEDGEQELADLKPADCYTLGRDTNVGYVCFDSDTSIVSSVAGVFPVFFFLVAALVCITTMTRMVEDDRTHIGILKALGYSSGAIMGKYLFYSGFASLIGCTFGFLGGSWLFPTVMWKVYGIMYSFTYPIVFVLDWKLAVFSVGLYLFCALGSTWLVCRSSLKEVAAELIRPKAPKNGKRILLERITFLWKRMSFLYKVSARNIFRYKKRLFMMVLGIGGSTALLLTGFGINDSIANVVDFQFNEISLYDSSVTFQDSMDEAAQQDFLEDCEDVLADVVFFHGGTVDVSGNGITKSVNLVVADETVGEFVDFHSGNDPVAYPGDGEVLINNGLADALGVSIGSTITIRDSEMNTLELTVSGIFDNYIYNYVFLTPQTAEGHLSGAEEIKSAYVIDREGVDTHAAAAVLIDHPDVASVSINADMQARVNAMLSSLNYVVLLVILCAACLAFIVLYNLTNININERIREIATIKVLGFYPGETASYVFRENVVLTGFGAVVGLILGRLLHAYVMAQIRIDMMHFDIRIASISYGFAVALTFLFAAAVNWIMYYRLKRINMAESLKSIE